MDEDKIILQASNEARNYDVVIRNNQQIETVLNKVKVAKNMLLTSSLDGYQNIDEPVNPKENFFSWIVKNQNQALGAGNPILSDFHRPMKLQMLLVPDAIM